MQAVKPRHRDDEKENDTTPRAVNARPLSPPPEPFPVDQLPPHHDELSAARTTAPVAEESDTTSLPPAYILDERDETPSLPSYRESSNQEDVKRTDPDSKPGDAPSHTAEEKLLVELDDLTSAIERLHTIAPRLHGQTTSPVTATAESSSTARARVERGKMKELERIWDSIERAHGRVVREDGQRVDSAAMKERRASQVGRVRVMALKR